MLVKNELGSLIPKSKEKIEKTLEWLTKAIKSIEKTAVSEEIHPPSANTKIFEERMDRLHC
jgi:hypothetical protein